MGCGASFSNADGTVRRSLASDGGPPPWLEDAREGQGNMNGRAHGRWRSGKGLVVRDLEWRRSGGDLTMGKAIYFEVAETNNGDSKEGPEDDDDEEPDEEDIELEEEDNGGNEDIKDDEDSDREENPKAEYEGCSSDDESFLSCIVYSDMSTNDDIEDSVDWDALEKEANEDLGYNNGDKMDKKKEALGIVEMDNDEAIIHALHEDLVDADDATDDAANDQTIVHALHEEEEDEEDMEEPAEEEDKDKMGTMTMKIGTRVLVPALTPTTLVDEDQDKGADDDESGGVGIITISHSITLGGMKRDRLV
ncbi:FK506-binding protein 3-like [Phragmites australis]|uniref:FK506-binding protein 3-like n=1 Tax=Phragmites australis TaxID=29695 RepID=UPI002D79D4E9|nr:FK506-binding protein 3-like [Phragmites australis]